MSDPIHLGHVREALASVKEGHSANRLARGGGGPHNPGMEARVNELEKAVTAIRIDLAEIKGKLSHMPTTWSLIVIVIGLIFTVMGGTLGIARLMHP